MPDAPRLIKKSVSLPEDVWQDIDDYRFENRMRTEAEAVRKVVEAGLKALKRRG